MTWKEFINHLRHWLDRLGGHGTGGDHHDRMKERRRKSKFDRW